MYRQILMAVIAAFFLTAAPALAMPPSPQDVEAAVHNKNFGQAETMLREVIAAKPASARAHYQLGQVLGMEGKHQDAVNELSHAQSLDPSLGFASTKADFLDALAREKAKVGYVAVPPPQAQTPPQQHVVASAVTPSPVVVPAVQEHSSNIGFYVVGLCLVLAIGAIFLRNRAKAKEAQLAQDSQRQQQLSTLMGLQRALGEAKHIAETSNHPADVVKQIQAHLQALDSQIRRAIDIVRSGTLVDVGGFQDEVDVVTAWATVGSKPAAHTDNVRYFSNDGQRAASQGPVGPGPSLAPTAATPSTVVVNSGSNAGFVEGMILGEIMSGPRRQEVIVERERVVERDDRPSHRRSDDSYSGSNSSSSFDSGSGGSSWGGDSSSSFDSGSGGSDW